MRYIFILKIRTTFRLAAPLPICYAESVNSNKYQQPVA